MSKPATTKPAASVETPSPSIRTLKIATCPSLSGQSQLTYHIGCNAQSGILFRITGNSGAGIFGNEWIGLADIQNIFDAIPPGKLIRSALLKPLYQAKSINTPAFLLAALISEGLVSATENQGYYLRADPGKFMAEITALMDSGVDLQGDTQSGNGKVATEKAATRKKKSIADPAPA